MPKAMKKSSREQSPPPSEGHYSIDTVEASGSDQDQDPDVSFHPTIPPKSIPTMFMPYIEGPKMNWTVDDGLYHRFLKWHLKCKTILNCELANLPTKQKCQKVIAWYGDFGMDLYVSWNISKEDLTLDGIWTKFEEFSKPQTNKVRARFNLSTSFKQGNRNMDEWYNAIQAQVNLAKYPPETAQILHHDIFWFFMRDEDFITKTIDEGNVDYTEVPSLQSSLTREKDGEFKSHSQTYQTSCWGPAISINTINATSMHSTSCQELSQEKTEFNHKAETTKPWKLPHPGNHPICKNWMHVLISAPGAVTHCMQRDFNVQLGNSNVRYAISLAILLQCVIRKVKANTHPIHSNQENRRHNNFMWGPYTPTMMQTAVNLIPKRKTLSVYR